MRLLKCKVVVVEMVNCCGVIVVGSGGACSTSGACSGGG